jgi:hypothetical protein
MRVVRCTEQLAERHAPEPVVRRQARGNVVPAPRGRPNPVSARQVVYGRAGLSFGEGRETALREAEQDGEHLGCRNALAEVVPRDLQRDLSSLSLGRPHEHRLSCVGVLLGAGCSPHEFKDPTSATTEVLYTKPATLKPPADPPNTAVPGPILGTPSTSGPPQPATTLAPSKLPGATEESTRSARRDVLELVTGDRVEGAITQLNAHGRRD